MAKTRPRTTRRVSKAARQPDKFVVWIDRSRALVCDWHAELQTGCKVLWIENGFACDEGVLVTSNPNKRTRVDVLVEDRPNDLDPIVRQIPRIDVARVVGIYGALDERGMLPAKGLAGALRLARPWAFSRPQPALGRQQ